MKVGFQCYGDMGLVLSPALKLCDVAPINTNGIFSFRKLTQPREGLLRDQTWE